MNGILSKSTDPAINLATEEYLLRHTKNDIFFLYTNTPSIIVGKHQNTLAEINFTYTQEHQIPVYRRMSGGGTVYHDLKNLNFCFIQTGKKGELVNFERYSEPILIALQQMGINATFGKRHDIQIDGKKISGNASHVFKNRVMHHGTLLFDSELAVLNKCLKNNPLLFKDKAVKSVRSEVTNINNHLPEPTSYEQFVQYIFNFLLNHYNQSSENILSDDDKKQIEALSRDKYNQWEWNYGYSPNFELKKRIKLNNGIRIQSFVKVQNGQIIECRLNTPDESIKKDLEIFVHLVENQIHSYNLIKDIISKNTTLFPSSFDKVVLLSLLFN